MDAVPFLIESTNPDGSMGDKDFGFLTELRQHAQWQRRDALLLAEANVDPDQLTTYFGDSGGSSNRLHMLFDFLLNGQIMLALARRDPEPVIEALRDTPPLPAGSQWATFLRNHNEVDLSRLTADQRQEVFAEFGPQEDMRLYGRGSAARLAPMLGGDQRRIRLAYSLQFTLRGTPVIRYGEEIGMGDDLSLPDREAIRTPMQWSHLPNAGFSTAAPGRLVRPVVTDGTFGYGKVNVRAQRNDHGSLLSWFEQMMRTLRECPEINTGSCRVDVPTPPGVLAHRADGTTGTMLFLHNLDDQDATVDLSSLTDTAESPTEMLADCDYGDIDLAELRDRRLRLPLDPPVLRVHRPRRRTERPPPYGYLRSPTASAATPDGRPNAGLGLGARVRLCDCESGTLVCVMPSGHLTAKPEPGNCASPGPSSSTGTQPKPDAQITPCRQQTRDDTSAAGQ